VSVDEPISVEIAELRDGCTVCGRWAEQDEGPYHRDSQPVRRDVTEDREGAALQLGIRLATEADEPMRGAAVEIWQCDALGRYSGFPPPPVSRGPVTATKAPRGEYLPDDTFLRGGQFTDGAGMVEFRTIYPGWYPGRTVHIHVRVNTPNAILTSQLYFPDQVSDEVLATPPYSARPGRDTTNATTRSTRRVVRPRSSTS
jgi:protocatechuate 3,4-dioxygenase beta subunit